MAAVDLYTKGRLSRRWEETRWSLAVHILRPGGTALNSNSQKMLVMQCSEHYIINSSLSSYSFFINNLQTEKEHKSVTEMEEANIVFPCLDSNLTDKCQISSLSIKFLRGPSACLRPIFLKTVSTFLENPVSPKYRTRKGNHWDGGCGPGAQPPTNAAPWSCGRA